MKYLLDSEILNWNDRLMDSPYMVMARYHHNASWPMILFRQKVDKFNDLVTTLDPFLKFSFTFSISKNRTEFFWHLFDKWYDSSIENKTIYSDSSNDEKISTIEVTDKIITSKDITEHMVLEKEYTRYNYQFNGKLSSIMAYVMFLEDTIEIFSKIWGYSEDGAEICLTKFQIGSVVSKKQDRSKDYLILDYLPSKSGGVFSIDYQICEMVQNGHVIKYGLSEVSSDRDLTYSRDNRIDDILS